MARAPPGAHVPCLPRSHTCANTALPPRQHERLRAPPLLNGRRLLSWTPGVFVLLISCEEELA